MNAAIEYCIGHGILEDILRKHRSQVLGSLLEEFDEKKYAKTLREEGYEAGMESGRKEGYASGRTDGLSEGESKGSFSMLVELVNDGTITIQKAAEKAGMDEAAFKKKMNEQ